MTHTTSSPALLIIDMQRGIRGLVIVGVSTNYSVEARARSVDNLGFTTTAVSDATFTFDMQGISGALRPADDVHVMSLSNLRGDYARILCSAEVTQSLVDRLT
jgi:nicotinamidase-related amidase